MSQCSRGVSEGGAGGLARGALRGATGVLVRPLAAALEASATFADNIRKAVGGGGGFAVRCAKMYKHYIHCVLACVQHLRSCCHQCHVHQRHSTMQRTRLIQLQNASISAEAHPAAECLNLTPWGVRLVRPLAKYS